MINNSSHIVSSLVLTHSRVNQPLLRHRVAEETFSDTALPQQIYLKTNLSKPALTRVILSSPPPQKGFLLSHCQKVYLEHAIQALRKNYQNLKYQKLLLAQQKLDWQDAVAVMRLCHQLSGNDPKRFAELCREALFNKEWGLEKPTQSKQSFSDQGIQDRFADPYNSDGQLFHIIELALPASSNSVTYYGGLAHPSFVMGLPGGYQLIRFWHEVFEVKMEQSFSRLAKATDWLLGTKLHQHFWPNNTGHINPGLPIGAFHWRDWNTYPHSAKMHKLFRSGQIEAGIRYLETQMLLPAPRKIEFRTK
jgi:hypothetical protein